jgi:hypothetical protein
LVGIREREREREREGERGGERDRERKRERERSRSSIRETSRSKQVKKQKQPLATGSAYTAAWQQTVLGCQVSQGRKKDAFSCGIGPGKSTPNTYIILRQDQTRKLSFCAFASVKPDLQAFVPKEIKPSKRQRPPPPPSLFLSLSSSLPPFHSQLKHHKLSTRGCLLTKRQIFNQPQNVAQCQICYNMIIEKHAQHIVCRVSRNRNGRSSLLCCAFLLISRPHRER